MTYFAPPTTYQSKTRCICGGWLYHSDRSNGYCYRIEFTDATGQPLTHCPRCGVELTGRWLQRCGEWWERQRNQKADAGTSASGSQNLFNSVKGQELCYQKSSTLSKDPTPASSPSIEWASSSGGW